MLTKANHLQVDLPNGPITWATYEKLVRNHGQVQRCLGVGSEKPSQIDDVIMGKFDRLTIWRVPKIW